MQHQTYTDPRIMLVLAQMFLLLVSRLYVMYKVLSQLWHFEGAETQEWQRLTLDFSIGAAERLAASGISTECGATYAGYISRVNTNAVGRLVVA